MPEASRQRTKAISDALGSTRTLRLEGARGGSPLSWLDLARQVSGRLVSTGGRPTDPHWDTRRLVPFRQRVWQHLVDEARSMGERGRKVGPAQLAACIIENYLSERSNGDRSTGV